MFLHNFKYSFITLFRNKMLIFWTFAFPIILGTFFNMAFSNIENSEKLKIIDIAIVNNEDFENNQIFKETFKTLSDSKNEDRLFETKYVSEDEAKRYLQDEEIEGYLIFEGDTPKTILKNNGINQTILKFVTEEILQTSEILKNVIEVKSQENMGQVISSEEMQNIYQNIYKEIEDITKDVNIEDISNNNLSYTMIEFYTLIAMTCLYGGMLGMYSINQNLPDMSNNGKRVAMSPTPKGKVVLSSLIASYITQLIGLSILFIYTIFVLKVNYGTNLPLIVLLGMVRLICWLIYGCYGRKHNKIK